MNQSWSSELTGRSGKGRGFSGQHRLTFDVGIPEWVDIDRFAIAMTGEAFASRDSAAVEGTGDIGSH